MPDKNRESKPEDEGNYARSFLNEDDSENLSQRATSFSPEHNSNISNNKDKINPSPFAVIGGSLLGGAFIGVLIGTLIFPGIGSAIGAGVGAFVGLVIGAVAYAGVRPTSSDAKSAESRDNDEARQSNSEEEANRSELRESIDLSDDNQIEIDVDLNSDPNVEDHAPVVKYSNHDGPSLKQLSSHSNSEENSNEESNRASYNNPN